MSEYGKHMKRLLLGLFLVFLFGTLGYYYIEDGWSLFDAFYMVAITITTVGYSEIHDLSLAGRIFTIFIIFTGFGGVVAFSSHMVRLIIEGELSGIMIKKRMSDRIKKCSGHYVVCGHGRTGSAICSKLYEMNIPFVVIELKEEPFQQAKQRGFLCVEGNPSSDIVLLAAGIERAAGIVVCVSDDAATIFITLAARELNSEVYIIAQAGDPTIESRFIRAGADKIIYPLRLGGEQVAHLVAEHKGLDTADTTFHSVIPSDVLGYSLKIFRHFGVDEITVGEAIEDAQAVKAIALITESGEEITEPGVKAKIPVKATLIMLVKNDMRKVRINKAIKTEMIKWTDEMMLGIQTIDEEHRSLVLLANKFQKALLDGISEKEVSRVLRKLIDYTDKHFVNEEKLMLKHSYPGLIEHREKHQDLIHEVMALSRDKKYIAHENISEFLNVWLVDHVLNEDKKYGKYIAEKDLL